MARFTGLLGLITFIGSRLRLLHQSPRHPLAHRRLGPGPPISSPSSCSSRASARRILIAAGNGINKLLSYSFAGSAIVFGDLGKRRLLLSIFAFQFCPPSSSSPPSSPSSTTSASCSSIIRAFAWVMQRTMGISGAESINVAACIFMGQTEAPLTIRPSSPEPPAPSS